MTIEFSGKKKPEFEQATIDSLVELGGILRKIHERVLSEGYTYKDGKFIPPETKKEPESDDQGEAL